ncbi:hypothetical protein IE077_004005 [Cardiosporidium cionae]|uniref:Uncharacterized protein n=1 Tax=Cardiosporidium cionae TaxID=476202 RepID=A0ABQ7JED0_9APIC|nr:hypothetical protein IE077_004005 [Cardiosporidium cionae]|eukprot:KAF8822319.1 hypothetical protein IE077_004005 [Cardiosporidium cionae]
MNRSLLALPSLPLMPESTMDPPATRLPLSKTPCKHWQYSSAVITPKEEAFLLEISKGLLHYHPPKLKGVMQDADSSISCDRVHLLHEIHMIDSVQSIPRPNSSESTILYTHLASVLPDSLLDRIRITWDCKTLPNCISVIRCLPSVAVPAFVDNPGAFEPYLSILCLESACPLEFIHLPEEAWNTPSETLEHSNGHSESSSALLHRCELLSIFQEERFRYTFSIPSTRTVCYSSKKRVKRKTTFLLMFRLLKPSQLLWTYSPLFWKRLPSPPVFSSLPSSKSDNGCSPISSSSLTQKNFPHTYVYNVYDCIASHFNHTR